MAERRMFAKTIIDSDAFLDMPLSTQALYFHLSMRADDDGFINNPKKVQRMIGSSDDDLKLLVAKNFIIPFESGIVVIKHWKIHNYIRNDRYKETVYQEERKQLVEKENKAYTFIKVNDENYLGIPNDNQVVYQMETQDRLGKDSIGKDSIDKDKIPYEKIIDLFHSLCPSYSKVMKLTDSRKKTIKARYNEYNKEVSIFETLFRKAEESNFLKGQNDRNWKATFDWLINPNNMVKVLEDTYKNKTKTKSPNASIDWNEWDKKNNSSSQLDSAEIDKLLQEGEIF